MTVKEYRDEWRNGGKRPLSVRVEAGLGQWHVYILDYKGKIHHKIFKTEEGAVQFAKMVRDGEIK